MTESYILRSFPFKLSIVIEGLYLIGPITNTRELSEIRVKIKLANTCIRSNKEAGYWKMFFKNYNHARGNF